MKKVFYIIINYNDYKTTLNLINNIKDYKMLDEIVVIDNKSTDDSVANLKKISNITLICNETNDGFARAINIASKYLIDKYKDGYIIISNSDIRINKEKDIKKLISDFKNNIAVVGPTIQEPKDIVRGIKHTTVNQDILLNIPLINRLYKNKMISYKDNHYNKDVSIVDMVKGCFFIIDSKALEKINYLDENTFLYYEENILYTKLKVKGYKTLIDNEVTVYHDHAKTISKNIKNVAKYKIVKDSMMYYEKQYNDASAFQLFILKILNNINLVFKRIRKK